MIQVQLNALVLVRSDNIKKMSGKNARIVYLLALHVKFLKVDAYPALMVNTFIKINVLIHVLPEHI
jgi:hypothetical protein